MTAADPARHGPLRRIPLTTKMVLLTTLVGVVLWTVIYVIQSRSMGRLFRAQLENRLELVNEENRLRFDRHIKAQQTLLKLFPTQHRFQHYINDPGWRRSGTRFLRRPPAWFPRRTILRNLAHPRYALLMDPDGKVREVYQSWEEKVPEELLAPNDLLREQSHDQVRMTELGGRPFLVASEPVIAADGDRLATVMLASPLDNEFLMAAHGPGPGQGVMALLDDSEPARVVASSRPQTVRPGTTLRELRAAYMVAGNSHFDYGASDLQVRFATLVPVAEVQSAMARLLAADRRENLVAAAVFILAASLLMFLVTRRIERLGRRVHEFGEEVAGRRPTADRRSGDQLAWLEERFHLLAEEVMDGREALQRQAESLRAEKEEQLALNRQLKEAQGQLLQSEKMASVGQLAAGVAHEINNPIGYVNSNLGSLEEYLQDLFRLIDTCDRLTTEGCEAEDALGEMRRLKGEVDLEYLRQDLHDLVVESREGLDRVKRIIQDLKDFSRADQGEAWQWADLHAGLDSTLNIVWNELKYKAEVEKAYGELPQVRCLPSQLNQVFMNLLVNAGHAIEERGMITLRTGTEEDGRWVWVEVADTGCGIPEGELRRVFEPFFTTKPVGRGTGLGLSMAYNIVEKHGGRIEVESAEGEGTTFRVHLPVEPPDAPAE